MEKEEINLDNPIFVYYLNVDGMSHQSRDEYISKIQEFWSFQNIVTWIVPRREGETKIECVYDGRIKDRGEELKELIEEINEKIDTLSESGNFDDFKIAIRDWRIKNLLN
jgi:hypothetical protein